MTHPSPDQWMAYLYGELDGEREAELREHLQACPDCRVDVATWRGVMKELDAWRLLEARARAPAVWACLRWAAAAVLIIGLGLAVGWLWAPDVGALRASLQQDLHSELSADLGASVGAVRAELREELSQQLRSEFSELAAQTVSASSALTGHLLTDFAQSVEAARAADHQAIGLALGDLESRRLLDDALLRGGLEALATVTEDEFLRTREDMVRLVVYGAPGTEMRAVPTEPNRSNRRSSE